MSLRKHARLAPVVALLTIVAACSSSTTRQTAHYTRHYSPSRYYPPPGPGNDPWGPYIHEASGRFGMPEQWIRAVMRQESGGQEDVISWAGAMGLMQVMPATYDELRGRYSVLGDDPFDPHNNILAGTAYLREMYDRYGAPGFLAAYNAGPNRVDRFLNSGTPLPEETVSYVAAIGPRLGPGTPFSGPTAVYVRNYNTGGIRLAAARTGTSGGCDPDAAYNPDGPCTPLQPQVQQAVLTRTAPMPAPGYCDPDAAYDPSRPCQPRAEPLLQQAAVAPTRPTPVDCDPDAAYDPSQPCQPRQAPQLQQALVAPQPWTDSSRTLVSAVPLPSPAPSAVAPYRAAPVYAEPAGRYASIPPSPQPQRPLRYAAGRGRPLQEAMGQPVAYRPTIEPLPQWAIQVGAYPSLPAAEAAADRARALVPELLHKAKVALPPTTPLGTKVAFRARLSGLTAGAASDACSRLSDQGLPCVTVPPAAS